MEQERYWMWTKRKEGLNSHVLLSNRHTYGDSWEEQAFAEDAAGPLGGCIWPPRSYTCSFCRREFRSAQALGGHMNVHRRDRARLKQSPGHNSHEMLRHHHNQILNPSQVCHSMIANPNSDHCDHAFLASPSSISSRVSMLPTPNINKKTFLPPFTSPFVQENLKSNISSPFSSWTKLEPGNYFHVQGLDKEEKGSKVFESNCIAKRNQITNDLSMNLNLMIRQRHETTSDDQVEDVFCYKRRRIDETLSFFPKRVSVDRDQSESEVLDKLSPSSVENLDLELRLGDRPK